MSRIALPRNIQGALEYQRHTQRYRLWLHTNDYVLGTYLELCPDGKVLRVVVREGEGDDIVLVRPSD